MVQIHNLQSSRVYKFISKIIDNSIGVGSINWPAFALMRFSLSFIVVTTHAIAYTKLPGPLIWIDKFNAFNAIIGFLLISGFSIGTSILKNQNGYFWRRVKRIYPVYISSIILHYIVVPQEIDFIFTINIAINLVFLNQLVTKSSYVGPAWTLALEVWLYALAPFFLRLNYKTLFIISILSFISYCFYTCGRSLFDWFYYSGVGFGLNLLFLSFIWVSGFMLAIFNKQIKSTSLLIGTLLLLHFSINFFIALIYNIKHQKLDIFFSKDLVNFLFEIVCLISIYYITISNRKLPIVSFHVRNVCNFLGNVSYPLYLTHSSALELCKKMHIDNWGFLIVFSFTLASIIYYIFDYYTKEKMVVT